MQDRKRSRGRSAVAVLSAMALIGAFATAATAASAAQYHSESAVTTELVGVQNSKLEIQAPLPFTCTGLALAGSMSGSATSNLSFSPSFTGCTTILAQKVVIEPQGCSLKLGEPSGSASPFQVGVGVECPIGREIVIRPGTAGCTYKVGPQTQSGGNLITNIRTSPESELVKLTGAGLQAASSGGTCGPKGRTTLTVYGEITVKGYRDAKHSEPVGVFVGA
jgi:hypothetical protein